MSRKGITRFYLFSYMFSIWPIVFCHQTDFDDGHCPSWRNQLTGLYNVYRAVHNEIPGVFPCYLLRRMALGVSHIY